MADRTVALVLGTSSGGVGTHVRSLARGLTAAQWQVRVCGPQSTEDLFRFTDVGAEFRPIQIVGAVSDLTSVAALRRAVNGCVIVHAHGLRAGAVAGLSRSRPLIVTWHNARLETSRVGQSVSALTERFVARSAAVNLTASADLAAHVRRIGGRDVRAAPVAVTPAAPTRTPEAVRAELGVRPGQQLVLAVGRLHPQKALDILIGAAARWPADEVLVCIAGDGPLEARLQAQITSTRAPVRLLGRRADIADLLAAADLVVLPSRWEARSLVAQEALLAGRPLIATAVGGLPELVGDGAQLVPPNSVEALDVAVRGLLADPVGRAELAARGRRQAAEWPTEATSTSQISAVYTEVLVDRRR
jgi:glycosyltransferase involved in cell wall biosynthesis